MSEQPPKKRGRGRPPGSTNKVSRQIVEELKAQGREPLEFLIKVMMNEHEPEEDPYDIKTRVDAAKAAAPFCHAKLQSIEVKAALTEMSHEEWIKTLL